MQLVEIPESTITTQVIGIPEHFCCYDEQTNTKPQQKGFFVVVVGGMKNFFSSQVELAAHCRRDIR